MYQDKSLSLANLAGSSRSQRVICLFTVLFVASLLNSTHALADRREPFNASKALTDAYKLVNSGKYKRALRKLRKVVVEEPDNADAWSLIGFSERKRARLKKAETAYKRALSIEPEHLGALSYQGELFLQQERRELAESNREKLASLCPAGCKELDSLDKALSGESGESDKLFDY